MKTEDVSRLITIVTDPKTDFKAIALILAHLYPTTFFKCFEKVVVPDDFEQELIHILNQPMTTDWSTHPKIMAIKHYKRVQQCDIKTAKNAIEDLIPKWRERKIIPDNIH